MAASLHAHYGEPRHLGLPLFCPGGQKGRLCLPVTSLARQHPREYRTDKPEPPGNLHASIMMKASFDNRRTRGAGCGVELDAKRIWHLKIRTGLHTMW